jgi:hypothetical protein
LGLLLRPAAALHADAPADMMRALVAKYSGSVVSLRMVLKASQNQQAEMEASGIVIDPNGLVVTTNTAIDPGAMYAGMLGEDAAASMTTSVVSMKIVLASGQELPARVVLRDKDRNIAIVRPLNKPAHAMVWVNFKGNAGARLGDPAYILGRLGKAGGRKPQATSMRIISVVEKPRRLFVLDPSAYSYLGNVVFNESGQPLGMMSMRVTRMGRSMNMSDTFVAVVVPTSDVWEVAVQAPAASAVHPAHPIHRAQAKAAVKPVKRKG